MESIKLGNKNIFPFKNKKEFLDFIHDKKAILVALNAEKLLKKESRLTTIINENIGYPDGIGAVLALRRKGIRATKIAGAEFWLDIINAYKDSRSFYLIGASKEVIAQTVNKLVRENEGINIVGFRDGFLNDHDKLDLIADLIYKKPDIVFVAQGSPRQEFLMEELLKHHKALYMGLGGSFDVYTGTKKRAPMIYQKLGLEWLYRLLKEPTRISRQASLIKFFIKVIFGRF
jgi:UDP-N-acetyl-D-mannosaminouronate:lipid I N-acetyl-D-mannosaminouronosyltransferase